MGGNIGTTTEVGSRRREERVSKTKVNDRRRLNPRFKRWFESGVDTCVEE